MINTPIHFQHFLKALVFLMGTIVRNTTLGISRRAKSYEPLNKEDDHGCQMEFSGPTYTVFTYPYPYDIGFQREFSGPRSMSQGSYNNKKTERARQRQIFLQTYKLSSIDYDDARKFKGRKLKRVVNKVKSSFLSAVSFIGAVDTTGSSCKCAVSISAYSPRLIVNCC